LIKYKIVYKSVIYNKVKQLYYKFKSQFFRNRDLIVLYNDVSNQLLIKYKIAEIDSCQIKKIKNMQHLHTKGRHYTCE